MTEGQETVRSLESLCARAIVRAPGGDSDWMKTAEFQTYVKALKLPKALEDIVMTDKCDGDECEGCRWPWQGHPGGHPGCGISYDCDCCTCTHPAYCLCEHCQTCRCEQCQILRKERFEELQSSSSDSSFSSWLDWASADHPEGACTNYKCDANNPCRNCSPFTDDEAVEVEDDGAHNGEEEKAKDDE